ncbi:LLM class flavin-dependent oxidoreductase [Streptosporangium sp. NBC_01639]|uniref:LLM class flavin-dependent oxidoreductase n=1 Tax=Streptosporangium sp. NBC_01639 TaxID=2975948 RepID=UPI00386DD652|nr:LLM class flavin-dependent oxidoreductase [Streptosporangium sp. NBC_01639]
MRITYGPWGETLAELTEAARAAEDAGADVVWLPELHRSAMVPAAAVAVATSRARVGTAVALAFTRSPMVTALEALDLDELSGGRLVLGLGAGARRLNESWHDVPSDRPLTRLRETVAVVRRIVRLAHTGEPMTFQGELRRLDVRGFRRPHPPARPEIPLYLAAVGPQLTRLAGEIANGWLSHELCSPAYLRDRILPNLEAGRARRPAGRAEVVVSACCSVADDAREARRRAAGTVGFYATVATYRDFFAFHGLEREQAHVVEVFRSGVPADGLAAAVPDAMVESLTLAGTPDEVAARVAGYHGSADSIKLTPPVHGLTPEEIRAAQTRVIALIKELTR